MAQVDYNALAQQAGAINSQAAPGAPAASAPTQPAASDNSVDYTALAKQAGAIDSSQNQPVEKPADDTGVMASVKRNTVGAITGIYHALTDPVTDEEKVALKKKVDQFNKYSPVKMSDDWANNPSPATLAYHRILDAPMEQLAEKSQKETDVAKDLLEHHEYWKGGNAYLSGLTDKVLSKVPLVGPFVNSVAERAEKGDISGAATDVAIPVGGEMLAEALPGLRAARIAKAKSAEAIQDFTDAHADVKKAIPSQGASRYDENDAVRARDYLEQHHEDVQPIRSIQDYRDAADTEIKKIDGKVKNLVGIIPNEPIATNVLEDVRNGLEQISPKKDFVDAGMKALTDSYDLDNPTMSQADRIREDLNAENQGAMSKNRYKRSVARKTDAGFAARELAANSLRDGVYNQLENHGIEGARELRQDQGSLIKMRNAAEAQAENGGKVVRGTGEGAGIVKNLGKAAIQGGTAAAGGAVGSLAGPVGTGIGAAEGFRIGTDLGNRVLNVPTDLTRDQLIERSFGKKVAVGTPTEPTVNLHAPAAAPTPAGQAPLLTNPSTLFDLGQTGPEAFATPTDIANAQSVREAPFQKVLDDPNATAVAKAEAKTQINKLRNSPIPREMIRKAAPANQPENPGQAFLRKNANAELARRAKPYQDIIDSPDHTAAEKAEAHSAMADLHKEADKIITQAEKAAKDNAPKGNATAKPAAKPTTTQAAPAAKTASEAGSGALASADVDNLADVLVDKGNDPSFAQKRAQQLVDAVSGKPGYNGIERRVAETLLDKYVGPERRQEITAAGQAALSGEGRTLGEAPSFNPKRRF